MKNPVSALLGKNISRGQIAGYLLSNIVGLCIIITGIMFYRDVAPAINPSDGSLKDTSYLVLSRRVSALGSKGAPFTAADTDSLMKQPWVSEVAPLTAAGYNVYAAAEMGGREFGTAMFFESVPTGMLDNPPASFSYIPGQREIPIIIPRDYLALYNFGFAAARNLPALSEAMAGSLQLTIYLAGERGTVTMNGRIVGFTNRVNSILVPEEFMTYANALLSNPAKQPDTERIMVKITSPGNPEIEKYLRAHDMESGADTGESHRLSFFLDILTVTVLAIGVAITLLALFIILLSISLLMQKSRREISGLLLLGYSIPQVSRTYIRIIVIANTVSLAVAAIGAIALSGVWRDTLASLGTEPADILPPLLTGVAITLLITLRSVIAIRTSVSREF